MKKNNKLILILTASILSVSMAGCGTKTSQRPNSRVETRIGNQAQRRTPNVMPRSNVPRLESNLNNNSGIDNNGNTNLSTNNNGNMTQGSYQRAQNIARRVAALNDVNSATAVITGNTALVGVDLKGTTNDNLTTNIRNKVETAVKEADKNITTVNVTTNPDLYSRISTIARNISNGRPLNDFANDIQDILRRMNLNR